MRWCLKVPKIPKILCASFLLVLSLFVYPAHSFTLKNDLTEVEGLFQAQQYQTIYENYLSDIPDFKKYSRNSELLFYYYALSCIYLKKFDEAEGYLYVIRTKKNSIAFPEKYDFIWAFLLDEKGDVEQAYYKYLFFVNVYAFDINTSWSYFRLAGLSQQMGRFERARGFYDKLRLQFPQSQEAQLLNQLDDASLMGYAIELNRCDSEEEAEDITDMYRVQELNVRVHRTWDKKSMKYLVLLGDYDLLEVAEEKNAAMHEQGVKSHIFPRPATTSGVS